MVRLAALTLAKLAACALPICFAASPAMANHERGHVEAGPAHDHGHHGEAKTATTPDGKTAALTEASQAYENAMQKMHQEMTLPYTNDVDLDFVQGMIPHHQGAIDQAQILLKYSKNPRLRLLAGGIIAAQKREIRFMKFWLEQHRKGIETNDMPVWLQKNPANLEDIESDEKSKE